MSDEQSGETDIGVYLLVIELAQRKEISVGALGKRVFYPGFYVYSGSAKRGLSKRIERHLRTEKKTHWHVDDLLPHSAVVTPFPIHTTKDIECALAGLVRTRSDRTIGGFGSSDCRCPSHLAYFKRSPLEDGRLETVFDELSKL